MKLEKILVSGLTAFVFVFFLFGTSVVGAFQPPQKTPEVEAALARLEKDPKNPYGYYDGAIAWLNAKEYETAADWIGKALKMSKDDPNFWELSGQIYMAWGKSFGDLAAKQIAEQPSLKDEILRVVRAKSTPFFEKAVACFDKAIRYVDVRVPTKQLPWCIYQRGLAYMELEQYGNARNDFQTVIDLVFSNGAHFSEYDKMASDKCFEIIELEKKARQK